MNYRAEIDGLRAIAVLPVILFHAGVTAFPGGFVGVDVFFVISGYFVTTLILEDLELGRFSIAGFYERRARRILPALYLVMAWCLPFAWAWMLPTQFGNFAQSLVAVTLFVSNILFWAESGYFEPAAEEKPLLHTWSLAVEEQFYLLFPLLLILLWRGGRARAFAAILLISILSFALSEWVWRDRPVANFYLIPSRAWELLAGAICAFLQRGRSLPGNGPLAALGLGLILLCIFAYDETMRFPGASALPPVLGAALVILFAQPGTRTARLLSRRLLVGVGLISYSAYLWHQPLFAFARLRGYYPPGLAVMLGLALLSLGLAWLSWRFVERPFRGHPPAIGRSGLVAGGAVAAAAFITLGALGHSADPEARRGLSAAAAGLEAPPPNQGLDPACDGHASLAAPCRTATRPEILLWGDSYAMHLAGALQASKSTVGFVQLTKSQCAPMLGIAVAGTVTTWQDCIAFNDTVLALLRSQPQIRYVVLSTPFSIVRQTVHDRSGATIDDDADFVLEQFRLTVDAIRAAGALPVVVSPPPANGYDIRQCLAESRAFGQPTDRCDFTPSQFSRLTRTARGFLERAEAFVPVIDLAALICASGTCRAEAEGVFLYNDAGHLSHEGSAWLGARFDLVGKILVAAGQPAR